MRKARKSIGGTESRQYLQLFIFGFFSSRFSFCKDKLVDSILVYYVGLKTTLVEMRKHILRRVFWVFDVEIARRVAFHYYFFDASQQFLRRAKKNIILGAFAIKFQKITRCYVIFRKDIEQCCCGDADSLTSLLVKTALGAVQ